jgi:hypothetical protein
MMSALGHKRKWCHARIMSVLPLRADMRQRESHIRYVPKRTSLMSIQCVQGPILRCRRTNCRTKERAALNHVDFATGEKGGDFNMSSKEDRPLDELTFKACQQALDSAFAVARQWYRETDPQLKAKLALQIIRDATTGEVNPAELQRRALEGYFLQRENRLSH